MRDETIPGLLQRSTKTMTGFTADRLAHFSGLDIFTLNGECPLRVSACLVTSQYRRINQEKTAIPVHPTLPADPYGFSPSQACLGSVNYKVAY
jgi:hypothetical protein